METEAGAARPPVKASYQRSGSVDHQRQSVLRFLAEPGHVNFGGKVHGGAVMKWVDQAGYTCAAGWSGRYCVTVYVGGIHFTHPIQVGNVVELQATVIHTGRSSMHIMVDIYAGDPKGTARRRCGHCVAVFVALDDDGRPHPVPSWVPATAHDRALEGYARRLVELRKAMEEEMHRSLHLDPDPTPETPAGV
ncbi:MAG TPA: acyl-CoA thioesterase [Gemmatimonadales bacterium]|nr:acyl-CoA thioesterase [Gemmatimonadales bacterium]